MATIKDVARLAGCSISTVSKYLNGGNVRSEIQEPIRAAIAQLDYRANPYARGLKSQRSRIIGILMPSITAPFYGSVIMSLDKILRENGYHTFLSCYSANHGLERDYLSFLINAGIDGLIYTPENLSAEEFYELTGPRSIPVVQLDRMIQGVNADAVLADNSEAVYQCTCHLIDKGHRRIAIMVGPQSILTAKERLVGYLRAMSDHNITYDDALVFSGPLEFSTGYQSVAPMLSMDNRPTAVISTNYDITIGLVTAMRERGIKIPDEIEIFGYDSVSVCRMMTPPLSVVQQPEELLGRTAGAYLIDRLVGFDGPPRQIRLKNKLII